MVMKITSLNIQDKQQTVNAYISTPEHPLKRVILGIDEGMTEDELTTSLQFHPQSLNIMHACMFGKTRTAIILFDGPIVSRFSCYTCLNAGLRTDFYPQPTDKASKNCNLQNREEGHKCDRECGLCEGGRELMPTTYSTEKEDYQTSKPPEDGEHPEEVVAEL
ncbi:hypothetical protein HPB49_017423 [Dermacentor silvarum]|uniref:Uncharacterized protein n=1 Tax=Dermacentor silvarum TaxID=543639 RepID=A0ACB8CS21_DERSI|nr:hypothetical protein HPB49_017423 [Dermacentor silvarum]